MRSTESLPLRLGSARQDGSHMRKGNGGVVKSSLTCSEDEAPWIRHRWRIFTQSAEDDECICVDTVIRRSLEKVNLKHLICSLNHMFCVANNSPRQRKCDRDVRDPGG